MNSRSSKISALSGLALIAAMLGSGSSSGGDAGLSWAKSLHRVPASHFASTYESAIFHKFCRKFPGIRPLRVEDFGALRSVTYDLPDASGEYQLLFELDEEERIFAVSRRLAAMEETAGAARRDSRLAWVGTFIYRLDAGDSLAMLDLTFYGDVTLHYRSLSSTAPVIRTLLADHQRIYQPTQINIRESRGILAIRLSDRRLNTLLIQLPVVHLAEGDVTPRQQALFNRILNPASRVPMAEIAGKETIISLYPIYEDQPSGVIIHLPPHIDAGLEKILYREVDGAFHADISVRTDGVQGKLWLEGRQHIPIYGQTVPSGAKLRRLESLLEVFFTSLLPGNPPVPVRGGNLEYRAYDRQRINLSGAVWQNMWRLLQEEAPLYGNISRVEADARGFAIECMVHALPARERPYYHFAEVTLQSGWDEGGSLRAEVRFYPFQRERNMKMKSTGY